MKNRHREAPGSLRHLLLIACLAGLFLILPSLAFAAPGDLDLTFGNGGIVFEGSAFNAMAIQSDGKIVTAGWGRDSDVSGFAVFRFNTNGSLDTSFGSGGIVVTPIGSPYDTATSIAILADGKIVVAGNRYYFAYEESSFAVVRYNPNGSLDTSFNGTGKVITSVGNSLRDFANSVAIQTNNKIVVAGSSGNGSNDNFAVVRYNGDGSLDTTFNETGKVIVPVGAGYANAAHSVTIQVDGKIVAAGYSSNNIVDQFAVVRLNPNGSLDASFNGSGIVITPVGSFDSAAQDVVIQTDGKIITAGYQYRFEPLNFVDRDFALVRYNSNGSLDTSFGGTGKIIIPVGNFSDGANSVAIQPDGKIVAAGSCQIDSYYYYSDDFAVVRLDPNGSLDTTFNGTGKVITPLPGGWDIASSVAIQSDGNIVVAGSSGNPDYELALAMVRYQGGSNANIRTRFDFDGDGRADISVFRPTDRVWYLNRSTSGFSATQFGLSTDKITPADFDGDGKTDIGVYRASEGVWYIANSSDGTFTSYAFGLADDLPTPADYDGDGKADLSVFRPSDGTWYRQNSSNGQFAAAQWGHSGDVPMLGDYDGDGNTDLAVFQPSNGYWYVHRSSDDQVQADAFGLNGDIPVSGDFNGDGRSDLAVFRPLDGTWYIARPTGIPAQNFDAIQFGLSTDIPAPADYDGDAKTDIAVYRQGVWYLLQSTGGFAATQFGLPNDKPIPAAYL